ncbi:MAG: zinc dependent phospholipase C family protein [Flavitalea sp.]
MSRKKWVLMMVCLLISIRSFCWGFYVHQLINYYAVFLLPPQMMGFYKPHINFISEHAVDPDKRRYAVPEEAPRHYIDMDRYGPPPYMSLKRKWKEAISVLTEDTLKQHGIVPWWTEIMLTRLTRAFRDQDQAKILKLSAELGHYIGDAHVPLHASSNHNGQLTNQKGIHGFWESRVPELLAEKDWDFFIGRAIYIKRPLDFIWNRVLESAVEADSVLKFEKKLSDSFPSDRKYAYEDRKGVIIKQYSREYSTAYNTMLNNMAERRFRQAVYCVSSFWYTAWVNAGQPDLRKLLNKSFSPEEEKDFEQLNADWKKGSIKGRDCD